MTENAPPAQRKKPQPSFCGAAFTFSLWAVLLSPFLLWWGAELPPWVVRPSFPPLGCVASPPLPFWKVPLSPLVLLGGAPVPLSPSGWRWFHLLGGVLTTIFGGLDISQWSTDVKVNGWTVLRSRGRYNPRQHANVPSCTSVQCCHPRVKLQLIRYLQWQHNNVGTT